MSETFTLQLATSAAVADLEAWLASAPPRGRAIYASGVDFPRQSAAAALVRQWQEQGLVALVSERDPLDRRRTNWIAERCGLGVPGEAERLGAKPGITGANGVSFVSDTVRRRADSLLRILRAAAPVGSRFACPSLARLADSLELGRGERGRQQVNHALSLLAREGAIATETVGPKAQRVRMVTVREARR